MATGPPISTTTNLLWCGCCMPYCLGSCSQTNTTDLFFMQKSRKSLAITGQWYRLYQIILTARCDLGQWTWSHLSLGFWRDVSRKVKANFLHFNPIIPENWATCHSIIRLSDWHLVPVELESFHCLKYSDYNMFVYIIVYIYVYHSEARKSIFVNSCIMECVHICAASLFPGSLFSNKRLPVTSIILSSVCSLYISITTWILKNNLIQ